jgi:antitoxin component of MazEF toxin-antitoxin module
MIGKAPLFSATLENELMSDLMRLEVKKIDNSDGLILSRELMQRLALKRGDLLRVEPLPGGGFRATPCDPDFERTMEIAEEVIDNHINILAALAK